MATSHHFTPRIPVPPHPTPLSVTPYTLSNSKAKKPPIYNPYDKFTQPEFDAWIGDITGALKRALGQREVDDEPNPLERTQRVSTGNATTGYRPIDLDESEDETVNDSFAEIKARRALGKGKARDPREGPGLGGTDSTKPIEIVSSDEEEEHEVELAIGLEDDDNEEEEEDEEVDYLEQEEDYSWERGQSSSQQFFSPAKHRKYMQEEEESEGDDSEEGSEEATTRKSRPTEVIDIVSDDEDEIDDDEQDRGHQEEEEPEEGSEGSGEEYFAEQGQVRLGTSHLKFHAVRIRTSRDSRHFHYAEEEEIKDEPDAVEDDGIEEIQPPEANTVFPSQVRRSPQVDCRIEICDPCAGPRIYTEDSYTSGDVRLSHGTTRLDPNHLSDDDSYEVIQDNELDADEVQVAEQDTSFPLHDEEQERPVDIPNTWVGPQTYVEDFYVGGNVRTHTRQEIDPSLLEDTVRDNIGVPSVSQIVTPNGGGYKEVPIGDEEQLENELDDDEEAVIQPPTQHRFTPVSRLTRRALPIPASVEFISIDDSDEEIGLEDQEPIKPGPLKVGEVEIQEIPHEDADEQNMELKQSSGVDEIVKEDTTYMSPLDSAPPNEADIPIATLTLKSSSGQQDYISMDHYESLYANIEPVTVQTEEQAKVISTLVDWNYPPLFPAGFPASALGHLATPSEESNADVKEPIVQAPDIKIDSPQSVDKESSPHPLVIPAEKDKVLVQNNVDHVTPPIVVEDSELQLTLIVDPSFSHTLSNDTVNNTWITTRDEGDMVEEAGQGRKIDVEITSEDVTQLVGEYENESAPVQKSLEDTVDGQIESRGVDTYMQEAMIHTTANGLPVSIDLNSQVAVANTEDDISSSTEAIDEQMDNQTQPSAASISSVQIPVPVYHPHHTYDYDQLPTPPPDQSPTAQSPLVANDGPSCAFMSQPRRHRVEIEEVQDEDDDRPQPFLADSAGLDLQIDIKSAVEPRYTVIEPEPHDEYEGADKEVDFEVELISARSASQMRDEAQSNVGEMHLPMYCVVEEPLTDGRLTEEPEDRSQSLGVVSVEAEESEAHRTNREMGVMWVVPFSADEEPVPLDYEATQVETNIQPQTSSNPGPEEPASTREPPTSTTHVILDSVSSTVEHDVPMPVTADPNVVDPTSPPDTPSHLSVSIPAAIDVQPQAQRQALDDGLFTPTDESTSVAPARFPDNIHSQVLDELAHVFFRTPIVSSTPLEELVPVSNADLLSDIGLVIHGAAEHVGAPQPMQLPPVGAEAAHISGSYTSGTVYGEISRDSPISMPTSPLSRDPPISMHVTLTRKPTDPILVSDPYPYSLSTPGISLMDPTDEDTEQDNSMSSNSTLEKDLEDKDTNSIPDGGDELELQYPPEPDVLAELNTHAAAEGEEASKIVDDVVEVDADGNFGPEFVVTRLPQQPSAEVQPAANLPTSDNTVAPALINGMEKNDASPGEILLIEPARGISSGDFASTETANHDLPEAFTTPPNEIVETSVSVRVPKRKRDSLRPPSEKVAATITGKVDKGKNKKVSKSARKGKANTTNQEVVDQTTSEATIHVKPRQKTQPVVSVASRALSKNLSEAWPSSPGTSTTHKMLQSSSRSSSVASSVPSDQSVTVMVLPSPTICKPNILPVQTPLQPISLFHAHGRKRSSQGNHPQLSPARIHTTQPPRPSIQRVISLPRINDFDSAAASPTATVSPTFATSPPVVILAATSPINMKPIPSPAVRHAPAISSSSPITRSHCRYHRISLPKEEGGPRVCFLVPGCSLNDRELMAAEEIEDHGDATHEDSLRMIKDIQSLNFDSYLIGILRQLVGLDILREQEVFYLPQPGEEVIRKTSPRKERSGLFRGTDSSSYAGSPMSIRSPASMKAPVSAADSTSTSLSAFRRRLDSEKSSVSIYSDTEFDPSDGEFPDAKRARPSPPDEQGSAGPMGPPLKRQEKRQLRGRRSKQIDVPEEAREGNSDDAHSRIVRKKPSKLGTKRRRAEIATKNDGEERILKKIKTRATAPISQPLVGDSTA